MTNIPRWILPATISVTVSLPSYAEQYLTVSAAQKLCFRSATNLPPRMVLETVADWM